MILSLEFGKNNIFAVLMENDVIFDRFTIDTPSVDLNRIHDPQECAQLLNDAMEGCKEKVKQCMFTIPMSMVVSKEMQAPKNLSEKNLVSFVSTNLQNIVEINENDYITDMMLLDQTGDMDLILGVTLRRDVVEKCLTIAKLCKLHCLRIDLRMNVLHQYMKRQGLLYDCACMAVRVSDNLAEICLFEENRVFNRMVELSGESNQDADNLLKNWAVSFNDTLMGQGEQTEKTNSLIDRLENIQNFQLNRNRQKPVEKIYFYGDVSEIQLDEIERSMGMEVQCLAEGDDLPFVVPIAAGMESGQAGLNLLQSYKRNTPKELEKKGFFIRALACAGVIFAIFLIAALALMWRNHAYQKDIDSIESYLHSTEVVQKLSEAQKIKTQLIKQKQYNQVLQTFNIVLQIQFRYQSVYIDGVLRVAANSNVTVNYYDYDNGALSMNCTAKNSSVAATYAKSIEQAGYASDVTFVGYSRDNGEDGGSYVFSIKGTVKEMP